MAANTAGEEPPPGEKHIFDSQTHRQTDRQTDSQTDRQTDRQSDKQTEKGVEAPLINILFAVNTRGWSASSKNKFDIFLEWREAYGTGGSIVTGVGVTLVNLCRTVCASVARCTHTGVAVQAVLRGGVCVWGEGVCVCGDV